MTTDAPSSPLPPTPPSEKSEAPIPAELAPAVALFEQGNFRDARAAVKATLAANPPPEIQRAAQKILERLTPDPAAFWVGVLTLALLALVTGLYVR